MDRGCVNLCGQTQCLHIASLMRGSHEQGCPELLLLQPSESELWCHYSNLSVSPKPTPTFYPFTFPTFSHFPSSPPAPWHERWCREWQGQLVHFACSNSFNPLFRGRGCYYVQFTAYGPRIQRHAGLFKSILLDLGFEPPGLAKEQRAFVSIFEMEIK